MTWITVLSWVAIITSSVIILWLFYLSKRQTRRGAQQMLARQRLEADLDTYRAMLARAGERTQTLLRLNQMGAASLQDVMDFALEEGVRLTQSKIGYLAFLSPDEQTLSMYAWSKSSMTECAIPDKVYEYNVAETGLWGEAIRQRRAIILNEYAAENPWKKGIPLGHVSILRHMNVPVFVEDRIVLLAGVGNKENDYEESDIQQLTLLMESMWHLIQHKRQEQALKASQERFELAAQATIDGIWEWNIVDRSEYFSPRLCEILGYRSEELRPLPETWNNLLHPEDRQRARLALRRHLEQDSPYNEEYRMRHKDGSYHWYQSRGQVQRDAQGNPIRMAGSLTDITHRKQAEEALRASEAKYRLMTENMSDVIWQISPDWVITYISPSDEKLRGFPSEEVLGRPVWDFIPPAQIEPLKQAVKKRIADYQQKIMHPTPIEFETSCKNGGTIWVEIIANPMHDANGEMCGFQGMARDITARKEAQKALEESVERLRGFIEQTMEAVCIIDENGQIAEWNRASEQMTGIARDDALGAYYWDMMVRMLLPHRRTQERRQQLEQKICQALQTGQTIFNTPTEFEHLNANGQRMITLQNAFVMKTRRGYQLGTIAQDITARKRAEKDLQESEERFRTIIEQMNEGLVLLDERGTILEWNPAVEKLSEVPRPQAIGRPIWEVQYRLIDPQQQRPKDLHRFQERVIQLLRSPEQNSSEWDFSTSNREQHILEQNLFPIRTNQGQRCGIMIRDVTTQKQAQQRIQLQLEKLKSLREIDVGITSRIPIQESLDNIAEHAIQHLRMDGVRLLGYDAAQNRLLRLSDAGLQNFSTAPFSDNNYSAPAWDVIRYCQRVYCPFPSEAIADGFRTYIGVPILSSEHPLGVLEAFFTSDFIADQEWMDYFETLAGQAAIAIDANRLISNLQLSNQELNTAYEATIAGWSRALELRDKETKGHSERVTQMASELAERIGLSAEEMTHFRRGVLLHDIGKMGIPDSILLKPGPLSDDEWMIMRQHPILGREMLKDIPYLQPALDVPYYHHERWDGSGYPHGMRGEQIPLSARIFAVVDVWDALISDRPYRLGLAAGEVCLFFRQQAGKSFDPAVTAAFLSMLHEKGICPNPAA